MSRGYSKLFFTDAFQERVFHGAPKTAPAMVKDIRVGVDPTVKVHTFIQCGPEGLSGEPVAPASKELDAFSSTPPAINQVDTEVTPVQVGNDNSPHTSVISSGE